MLNGHSITAVLAQISLLLVHNPVDEIWFDNMSIEDTTGSEGDWKGGQDNLSALGVMNRDNSGLENNYISVNQVGYFYKAC